MPDSELDYNSVGSGAKQNKRRPLTPIGNYAPQSGVHDAMQHPRWNSWGFVGTVSMFDHV